MSNSHLSARELHFRYSNGERDFSKVDLSGESLACKDLKGINLLGANLSRAKIRGTNFNGANLIGTQFNEAKAGTSLRWTLFKWVLSFFLIVLASLFGRVFWVSFATPIFRPNAAITGTIVGDVLTGVLGLSASVFFLFLIYARGFASSINFGLVIVPFTFAVTFAARILLFIIFAASGGFGVSLAISVGVAAAFASAMASVIAISVATVITDWFAIFFGCLVALALYFADAGNDPSIIAASIVGILLNLTIGFLISKRALKGDPRDRLVQRFAVWVSSLGGTKFIGADLTDADFSEADLKHTHLYDSQIIRTRLHLARNLHLARFGKTILESFQVRNLLVILRGNSQSYAGLNLKGANLLGADLSNADFTEADLSEATLEGADLQQVNFTKTQALGTQFRQATLTGTCLEAWNIDSTTKLTGAICQHIYLLNNQRERRPSSGSFQPGEFTKLFEKVLNTIDLIFQNGIDWKAFIQAFDRIRVDNDGTELTIQSIENKGDGVIVVRVDVPFGANKERIHKEFTQTYERIRQELEMHYRQQLNAKDQEISIYEQQSVQMWSVIRRLAERPPISTTENILGDKIMNDYSQSINVSGNFNVNAQNSVVNLRDISGQVTNQISQLSTDSTSDQPNLKDLLTQLQQAVEADTELGDGEKAEALAEVGELAIAAQNPKEGVTQKAAKGAMNALKGIAAGLSDVSKLASACKELLPLIMTAFGLP